MANKWSRDEQLLALRLYFLLPFGQLHQRNKQVISVAEAINRTPSAVAMKACNFASLDDAISQKGLGNVSQLDRVVWESFMNDSEKISAESEAIFDKLVSSRQSISYGSLDVFSKKQTESIREIRVRRVQGFFRRSVLVSYDYQCAISGLKLTELVIASHIIPWSVDVSRRADPTNGIALNALYDMAFDKGLIAFDDNLNVILSKKLVENIKQDEKAKILFEIEGQALKLPSRFYPDSNAIEYHRENIFIDNIT